MSTAATDFDTIQREMDEELKKQGIVVDEPQTQVQTKDDSAERLKALEAELATLKAQRQQPQVQYVDANEQVRPQSQPQPQSQGGFQRRKMTQEEWVSIAKDDPVRAVQAAINASMGLPEDANLVQILAPIAQQLQQQDQALKSVASRVDEERVFREAEAFMRQTPGYEATPENAEILDQYLRSNGLQATAAHFRLAYTQAVADGQLTPLKQRGRGASQVDDDGQDQANDVDRSKAKVPSLRGRGTSGPAEPDWSTIEAKLDQMPREQAKRYLDKLSSVTDLR